MRAALDVLSKNDNGFVLMVEFGRIDKYSHSLDWERAVYDTIMLDNAVKVAKDFAAARNNDTLIIVVPDHAHGVAIVGTYDDNRQGETRSRLGVYNLSQFPNYPAPNADGYPDKVDVSRAPRVRVLGLSGQLRQHPTVSRGRERSGVRRRAEGHRTLPTRRTARCRARCGAPATCRSTSTAACTRRTM